jgi:hypothetical protein
MRQDGGYASILDADLLAEHRGFALQTIDFSRQAYAGVEAVGRPATSICDGVMSQGHCMQSGGFDILRPQAR